jgi:ClpP class serine protease
MPTNLPNPANPHSASSWDVTVHGGLAIVPVRGVIYGGRTWACSIPETLFALANSRETQTVLIDLDCHGGELNGFDDIRRGIEVLRAVGKRTVAIAHDRAYSLGAMIGMLCDEFVCTPSAEVGQLGVVRSIVDQSKHAAEQGLEEFVSSSDPSRKVGGLSPIPDGLKANLINLDAHTWMTISTLIAEARGLDPDALRSMGAEIFYPAAAADAGIVDRVESYDVLVSELMDSTSAPAGFSLPMQDTRAGRAVASAPTTKTAGNLPRLSQELIMSTKTLLSSLGLAASAMIPGASANASGVAGRTAPVNAGVGKAKASADKEGDAEEMTEEEIAAKYPKAVASMKAKAAAEAAKAAADASAAEASAAAKKEEDAGKEASAKAAARPAAAPATIGELKAAFPDDGAYCFACLEQGLDMQTALMGKVKAQADQLKAMAAANTGQGGQIGNAKPAGTPAATAPALASSASLAARGQAAGVPSGAQPADFDQAVELVIQTAAANGKPISRGMAIHTAASQYPELHVAKYPSAAPRV